ncbi:unnamed protein product [Protopolystoma xenopodis]|uniref:Phosphatidylinositol-4,5-bisphosphate 4-phosphatase n=1 Tax=Protopolystoma xenopodis TaxID=117903 RepID=A0A3S5AJ43_9PLAT|nr:unnamed protein product [Protopolystoma xenopodis]
MSSLIAARCPHCTKVSSFGPAYARLRWVLYGIAALVFLLIAFFVTLGTHTDAVQKPSLYFLWSCKSISYQLFICLTPKIHPFLHLHAYSIRYFQLKSHRGHLHKSFVIFYHH